MSHDYQALLTMNHLLTMNPPLVVVNHDCPLKPLSSITVIIYSPLSTIINHDKQINHDQTIINHEKIIYQPLSTMIKSVMLTRLMKKILATSDCPCPCHRRWLQRGPASEPTAPPCSWRITKATRGASGEAARLGWRAKGDPWGNGQRWGKDMGKNG